MRNWGSLSLVLMDDTGLSKLNREYFGENQLTDVISFVYPPVPKETFYCGEVCVNVQCADREGRHHKGRDYELALYIAHGCHHLTGADDNTDSQRQHMRTVETTWLREVKVENLFRAS